MSKEFKAEKMHLYTVELVDRGTGEIFTFHTVFEGYDDYYSSIAVFRVLESETNEVIYIHLTEDRVNYVTDYEHDTKTFQLFRIYIGIVFWNENAYEIQKIANNIQVRLDTELEYIENTKERLKSMNFDHPYYSILCKTGLAATRTAKYYEADLSKLYIKLLELYFPGSRGEALYECAIRDYLGDDAFDFLRRTHTIESCGVTGNGKLYTY